MPLSDDPILPSTYLLSCIWLMISCYFKISNHLCFL